MELLYFNTSSKGLLDVDVDVIQIKRKLKRKWKQKRNGWRHLQGGALRPPRRFPRLRFCFRFRFNLRLIQITKNQWKPTKKPTKKPAQSLCLEKNSPREVYGLKKTYRTKIN